MNRHTGENTKEVKKEQLKNYIDEQTLKCVKDEGRYPTDLGLTSSIYFIFGSVGLTLNKVNNRKVYFKHVNNWQNMTAKQINLFLNEQEWRNEDELSKLYA